MFKNLIDNIKEAGQKIIDTLKKFSNSRNLPAYVKIRSEYILEAYEGVPYTKIALNTKSNRNTVGVWVKRFLEFLPSLREISKESPENLEDAIQETLSDKPRSGAPCIYGEEIRKSVILLCCQDINDYGLVANRWTLSLLKHVLNEMQISNTISTGAIYNILLKADLKPWKNRYYLHSKERFENYDKFKEKVKRITYDYLLSNIHRESLNLKDVSDNDECIIIIGSQKISNHNEWTYPDWVEIAIKAAFSTEENEIYIASQSEEWYNKDWVISAIESAMSEIYSHPSFVSISDEWKFEDWIDISIKKAMCQEKENKDTNSMYNDWFVDNWFLTAVEDAMISIEQSTAKSDLKYYEENKDVLINKFGFTEQMLIDLENNPVREIGTEQLQNPLFEWTISEDDINENMIRLEYNFWNEYIEEHYPELADKRESWFRIYSMDEDSGIQALEKRHPDIPAEPATENSPGKPRRSEFAFNRHGTTGMIAYKDVITGKIRVVYINKTRNEVDLGISLYHLLLQNRNVIKTTIICDNLNTHQSEVLVRLVSHFSGYNIDLGIKGRSGILKSQETRMAFLSNSTHRVNFHYTPVHCSWLNQIEVEFSIFNRRFYKGSDFTSVADLEERMANYFIKHNKYFAKHFKWSYHSVPRNPNEGVKIG